MIYVYLGPEVPHSPSPYCGRLDEHGAHEWIGHDWEHGGRPIVRECPGAPVIEGGNPARLGRSA